MRVRSLVVLLAMVTFAMVGVGVPGTLLAQTETGRISGKVLDPQGIAVPGVNVTATNVATGAARSTVTDATGGYVIPNVLASTYEISFQLQGFKTATQRVQVTVGAAATVDSKLELGALTETVAVTAAPTTINISNAEVATTVREEQIRELPTLTRNPYDLVALAGNVTERPPDTPSTSRRGTGFSLNGLRASGTNILLDGGANNNEFNTIVGQEVPLDSVQEFSVVSNNFSAQYGRATGGIVNVVTKSGTNQFRGTAYEFFRNNSLASNTPDNIANGLPQGTFKRNQTGYSIGGPVMKDKLHFFSSLEYIGVRSSDTLITWVPTPQLLAASNGATQAFFTAYGAGATINGPILTRGDVSAIIGAGAGAFNSLPANLPVFGRVDKSLPIDAGGGDPQDQYQMVNRVDASLGARTQLYIRYAYQNQEAQPGTNSNGPYSAYDTGYVNKNHNILGSVTHVFSDNFTSQTKLVYNRIFEDQPLNGAPQPTLYMNPSGVVRLQGYRIGFPGYFAFQPGNAIPFGGPQSLTQLYQDQTWLKKSHDIRFGGSYVHIADNRTFGAYENAVEALNTTSNALTSLNNLVLGQILQFQTAINPQGYPGGSFVTPVQLPSFTSNNRYNEFAFYAQDNWSMTNRLKLNLGLRYEYYGPQLKSDPKYDSNFYYGDPNVSVSFSTTQQIIDGIRSGTVLPSNQSPTGTLWKSDWNNFAPRLGFAYDLTGDGKTSLRGGYGIAYERNFGNVTYNVLFNPPQYLVTQIISPADVASQPIYVDNAGPFAAVAGVRKTIPAGSLRHVDQNIATAYSHIYGVSFQRELNARTTFSVEYNGSSGRELYDLSDPNKRGAPLVYEGANSCTPAPCTANTRPNPAYGAFNSRGNRGRSQYHGVTFSADSRNLGNTGLELTSRYTLSKAMDNLSTTFSDSLTGNGAFNLGYLDAFNPMLDWGYAEYDVRHRMSIGAIWNVPFWNEGRNLKETLLGGWSVNGIITAHSGYPFSIYDCTNGLALCMRALDPVGLSRSVSAGTATGNPNEYKLLDLAPILPFAGSYVNPLTGNSDFGPYPSTMTARDDFREPGFWNVDFLLSKRFRFGGHYAAQFRFEAYNLFNNANMYVHADSADVSSATQITGFKDDERRMQLGFKFEF
jgi:outer membrane receptor protein involved in Fe transport